MRCPLAQLQASVTGNPYICFNASKKSLYDRLERPRNRQSGAPQLHCFRRARLSGFFNWERKKEQSKDAEALLFI